jgi:hypothetical protein
MIEFLSLVTYFGHLRIHMFDLIKHKHISTYVLGETG